MVGQQIMGMLLACRRVAGHPLRWIFALKLALACDEDNGSIHSRTLLRICQNGKLDGQL